MVVDRLDLASLFDLYSQSVKMQELVSNNCGLLKCIRGGLRMAERHRLEFDPRADYWMRPERRLIVAYLADHWTGRFAPAAALRSVALQLTTWFDQARPSVVAYTGIEYDQGATGGFANICSALAEHARKMPWTSSWDQLRTVWSEYQAGLAVTIGDDVAAFLEKAPTEKSWDGGFKQRLPWFGYLGATSEEDMRARQAFFYGYANLWTTTNAYKGGGAQHFAPVIQNTRTGSLLDSALTWSKDPDKAPVFLVLGKNDGDDEPQDRSQFAPVLEVYGFLSLERAPYFITASRAYREWFDIPAAANTPHEQTKWVGEITRRWLGEHPEMLQRAHELFRELMSRPMRTSVEFETIEPPKVKKVASPGGLLLDDELRSELDMAAMDDLQNLTAPDGAAIALHLLLAGRAYLESDHAVSPPIIPKSVPKGELPKKDDIGEKLPIGLRPPGERALAYLNVGLHVLFAGAPGTGKTTLAQFVGYAWDHGLESLPAQMSRDDAPLTTVGNSAWSPFHTIGGLMPNADGTFDSRPGIFIDPTSTSDKVWRLLDRALVLDEMNRADLDRCIGELYPLLSGSVRRVSPAGLPGVTCIETSDRFRVIATINDANLDDIVFPISDGLARRFQRIDLPGGSRGDVLAFLGLDVPNNDGDARRAAAYDAVAFFFEVARDSNLFWKDDDDERLPFGVGYFALLRKWVEGRLTLVEMTLPEQARELLAESLRPLGRSRKWEGALRTFLSKA